MNVEFHYIEEEQHVKSFSERPFVNKRLYIYYFR